LDSCGALPTQEGAGGLSQRGTWASPRGMAPNTPPPFFELLVWTGAGFAVLGLIGLIWCIATVWRARRAGLADEDMRAVMTRVLPRNLGALFISVLGLMLVIVGVFLG